MRIKTQFIITMLLFGIVLVLISASAIFTNQQVEKATQQEEIASSIAQGASELTYLSNDYLIYRESQQLSRWQARFDLFSSQAASLRGETAEQQALVRNIQANSQRLKEVFDSVVPTTMSLSQDPGPEPAVLQVSWSRMAVQSQGLVTDATRLSQLLRDQVSRLQRTNTVVLYTLVGILAAYFFVNYVIMQRRTLRSIAVLQSGTAVIGSGHLDFKIEEKKNDEIGDLSRAFNRMTSSLKDVTASKTELEREIAERKQAENRANRQQAIQEGINRILEGALTCDTEEEMGRICLAVAEQLTGSKFGFMGELNSQGRLDDIAISDPGWDQCRMETPVGHGKLPHDLAIHGIYGRVLRDGRAFFTNNPSADPDRIGTPEGHPPITAFLGIPLTSGEKTFGMVGLGNRDGGYRAEDQETAEALASAMVDALTRKRAEEQIRSLNNRLRQRAQELEVANKELESFSYSVSHDLREPLRMIDGFSRILRKEYEGKLDEEGRRLLDVIRDGTHKMGQLISDLLAFSRLGKQEMRSSEVDMNDLAIVVFEELKLANPERAISFQVKPLPAARGDHKMIRQVFVNLLSNAIKFTRPRETAAIEVGAMTEDTENVYYVKDNGAGFDMQYSGKLFNIFQRLHSREQFEGTGVGLAIVHRIVQRHGGRVWADGKVDEGATFYFTLPMKGV